MHFDKIEDYDFDHGLSFNTQTGEYHSLNPHDLGRPLSHKEMDYNLMYQKQTVNGWRIAGSNVDLTLNSSDLGKVLAYHQVAVDAVNDPDNLLYDRHIAAGLFDGQLIWIPVEPGTSAPVDPCLGFEIDSVSFTNSLAYENAPAPKTPAYQISSTTATVLEGNVVTFNISVADLDSSSATVGWTMAPYSNTVLTTTEATTTEAPISSENSVNSFGFSANLYVPGDDLTKKPIAEDGVSITSSSFDALDIVNGQLSGEAVISNSMGQVIVQIKLDTLEEDAEMFIFKLAATDSLGNSTNEASSIVTIINVYNPPTTTADPCVDDIASEILECDDDIASDILECDDDIASAINELGNLTNNSGSGSGSGSGDGYGATTIVPVQPTFATLDPGGNLGGGGIKGGNEAYM